MEIKKENLVATESMAARFFLVLDFPILSLRTNLLSTNPAAWIFRSRARPRATRRQVFEQDSVIY